MSNKHTNRLNTFTYIAMLVFALLISRMAYLQIYAGKEFLRQAENNRISMIPILAPRGLFFDRNGEVLVSNRPGFSVSLVPISGPIPDEVIVKLAGILGMKPEEIREKIKRQSNPLEPVRIKSDLSADVVTKLEEQREYLPGVIIDVEAVRNYINKELGAHMFGYVGEISENELEAMKSQGYKTGSVIGKFGLEKVYDKEIRGENGGQQVEVDVNGHPQRILGIKQAIPGNDLVLTIDAKIQKAAEQAMDDRLRYLQMKLGNPEAKAGAVVVMNPQTGEILAMVSRPGFDPNLFNGGISAKDWKAINDNPNNPMQNRAINAAYPPGSSFKIVTGAAALETGKITPEEKIFDPGQHWVIPKSNAHGAALGWIDFRVALAKSDNVFFYELGNRLGIDLLEQWARKFGLGAKTGINLPNEDEGLVASRAYKMKVYEEEWYLSETFDAAIGQGFQLLTPIQMASMISQIANGGHRFKPYLVSRIVTPNGQTVKSFEPEAVGTVPLSEKTLNAIRSGLRDVVTPSGTAGYIFEGFPLAIAGKTSTAENPHGDDHGWFVAYGPYDNPTIAVAVIIEQGGYGSDAAAPIVRKIFEAAFDLKPGFDPADELAKEIAAKNQAKSGNSSKTQQ